MSDSISSHRRALAGRGIAVLVLCVVAAACGSTGGGSVSDVGTAATSDDPTATSVESTTLDPGPGADGSCTETVTSAIGQPVQVVVEAGDVDCPTAVRIVDTYYNDPPSEPQGSGGFTEVEGWECISTSAAEAERTGRYGSCSQGDSRIGMRPAPESKGQLTDSGLELAADGIGLATWGADRSEVLDAVSALVGEPTEVYENLDETSAGYDFHLAPGRYYTWDGLTLFFDRDSDGLVWYQQSAKTFDPDTGTFVAREPVAVETPEGVALGDGVDAVFSAYAPLQEWRCDYSTLERTVGPATDGQDGTLITGLEGYYITVEGGVVTDIGHARGDERDVCY